jgi:hypothetical protein
MIRTAVGISFFLLIGVHVCAQIPDQPAPVEIEIVNRLWVDATGTHMVRAKLLDVSNGKVKLQREDNQQTVEMALDQLSLDDKTYCIKLYEAIQQKLAEVKKNDIDPTAVTANQTIAALDSIDEANRAFSSALNQIESRNPTTLQRNKEFAGAALQFVKTITGKRLQVHFLVDDVEPTKYVSRDRRKIALTLSAPDIQLEFAPNSIEVWIETSSAEQLQRGDVLRMQGRVNESSRKSFGMIEFQLNPINVPEAVLASYREGVKDSIISKKNTFRVPFYIDTLRRLTPADAKAFLDAQGATQLPAIP